MKDTFTSDTVEENQRVDFSTSGSNDYQLPIVCDIDTLRTLIRKNAARIVDVRKEEEYRQGHIPTSVSLPLSRLLSMDSPEGVISILESIGFSDKILVDSRERLNFLSEHIPGAKNIPYTMLGSNGSILRSPDEIKRFIENRGFQRDSEFITYCGSVGTLSGLAYYALKLAGIKNVKLYAKSFREWKILGKPKEEFKDANYWDLSAE